jgi:sigma-E factor negative regulatory protein RseC
VLEEEGKVLSIQGEDAEVVPETRSTCGSCAAKSGCGTSLLSSLFPQRHRSFRARNTVNARIGDRVLIGLDESALQIASLLVYLAPLLGLIGGGILGDKLAEVLMPEFTELLSIVAGAAGFAGVLFVVRKYSTRLASHDRYQAVVLRILNPEERSRTVSFASPQKISNFDSKNSTL